MADQEIQDILATIMALKVVSDGTLETFEAHSDEITASINDASDSLL